MMHTSKSPELAPRSVVITRIYKAPVDRVWHALTTPEAIRQWSFPVNAFKPEVGFEFEFTCPGPDNVAFTHHCRVTVAIPPKRLAYTWRYAGYEGDSLVTIELSSEGDHTRVTLTHTGLETFPKLPCFDASNFNEGWTYLIGNALKKFVETT